MNIPSLCEGQILSGPLFDEPMRIETLRRENDNIWVLGLVGLTSSRFRKVHLPDSDLASLTILDSVFTYDGDGKLLRLGLQAYSLGIAYEFDPYFGLSISRVDPLPHQLEAVYDYFLKLPRVRFLLADDAGAGKTIMAGLLLRELQLRGLADQILIVCPANLTFQWQRELKEKFNEKFIVLKGGDIKEQYGVNQWLEQKKIITSLDLAKRTDILPGLRQVRWDLVIVDEAHRMSWTPPSRKTARYALGELLRDTSDHLLLMTATPHKGNPENFTLFLQLLDPDVYADVRSIREAMERRRAPFYLRRTKETMVYFPERQPDGTWIARKIFTKRIPITADFKIDGDEDRLYNEITRFVKRQSVKAATQGDNPRARAVGFLMALYQRRLASSIHAVRCSLENRARRLEIGLKKAIELTQIAPPELPDPEELEEMEEGERQRFEEMLEAVTLADNADQVRDEIEELLGLAEQAKNVEGRNIEAKLFKLKSLLQEQGFFENPDQRLLIFTEFKDTLDYLVAKLKTWGFKIGIIHGGMRAGSRDEPGTRLHAEQQFWDGESQILVATEAAGEGINLQVCNILFNYDIPWNPNRLEQRMGRIHRYGQRKDCLIFNFVATNTIEGSVLQRLMDRLKQIRDALDDDAVFNVIGEILPAAHVDRILRDYYAGKLGAADLEDRILQNVDEGRFRSICQNALEGLASKNLNLEMLIERRARAQERRVVPETIARFIREAADTVPMRIKSIEDLPHAFEPGKTPNILRRYEQERDWRLPALSNKYPKCSTDRETAESNKLEWVTPGHPLFEAIRRHSHAKAREALSKGACFYSLQHESPARMDFYRACVVDGLGDVIHERLFALEIGPDKEPILQEPNVIGNFSPATAPAVLSEITTLPEPLDWIQDHVLQPFVEEVRKERQADLERVAQHIEISLTELIQRADDEIGRACEEVNKGIAGAEGRLAQAENRHAELLSRREKRRRELQQQKSLTLQNVERMASVLILPHPEREAPELRRMRPNPETEATAMWIAMEYERSSGRQVFDVHEQNLGYDVTSLDVSSGELRLIEIKGLSEAAGMILLTPNERRVAEDRRDCYWLYIVTNCATAPTMQEPVRDPARFPWHEVTKVAHYWLEVNAMTRPMMVREDEIPFGKGKPRE
jgi:superfamily II DNA or RNA helicase